MANKTYTADSYYDGRFGTTYGERAREPFTIKARSLPEAFKKAFGFIPATKKLQAGTGYRYMNEQGMSYLAECFRIK